MLMEILGIILAFSTVMMLFGLLVTASVQFIQNIGLWRSSILSECLNGFAEHLQKTLGIVGENGVPGGGARPAPSPANELLSSVAGVKMYRLLGMKDFLHKSIQQKQLYAYLQKQLAERHQPGPDLEAKTAQLKALLDEQFTKFESEMTTKFTRRTHLVSFIVAFVIAVAFQLNTFSLFSRLSMDETFRNELIQVAEASTGNAEGPCNKIEEYATFEQKSHMALTEVAVAYEGNPGHTSILDVRAKKLTDAVAISKAFNQAFGEGSDMAKALTTKFNESKVKVDETHKQLLESCLKNNAQALSSLGFELFPNGMDYYRRGEAVMAEKNQGLAFANAWLGMLVSAIFISLGGPFWFDRIKDLVKLREAVQPGKK